MDKMSKELFIKDLMFKDEVCDIFMVKYLALLEAKDGKNYLNLILSDKSGDIESRIWHGAEKIAERISKGDYVKVAGKINIFQSRKQFIVKDITFVDPQDIDSQEFVASSKHSPEEMYQELIQHVESIDDYYIKELLNNILSDQEIKKRLLIWPAAKTIHHAYQSGLLEHTLSCTKLAKFLSGHYQVNESYVIAGTVLHDICKIYELSAGPMCEYTDEGKLVGHIVSCMELIDHHTYRIKNFPRQIKTHLKHIILSHHGELNFGSPKTPLTTEANLVHLIDLLDSRINTFETLKHKDNTQGSWTSMVKYLDGTIYKNELPTFKTPQEEQNKSKHKNKEIKQNMGSLLKDFKVT